MSSLSLYDLTVPIITRGLENLKDVLKKGEAWCQDNEHPPETLLTAKIADDMLPLIKQVQIASDTSKGILARIGGESATSFEDKEKTFAELYERIDKTVALLKKADRSKFVGGDHKVEMKMGPHEVTFTAINYVQRFVLPNFFFHEVTAYDILRQAGVKIGKADYLGGASLMS